MKHKLTQAVPRERLLSLDAQIGIAYFLAAMINIYSKSFNNRLYYLGGLLVGIVIIQMGSTVIDARYL